jgi:hypothetical protein
MTNERERRREWSVRVFLQAEAEVIPLRHTAIPGECFTTNFRCFLGSILSVFSDVAVLGRMRSGFGRVH